jgi:hypothetical protein
MSMPGHRYRCGCMVPQLVARIRNRAMPVHAAFTGDRLSRIYCARCARCHGRYTGPWQLNQ